MQQTRLVSLVEVMLNIGTGFIFAMLVWQFIIPVMFPRMAGPIIENIAVTATFTIMSIFRSYLWRRFFNNGLHATLVHWASHFWNNR